MRHPLLQLILAIATVASAPVLAGPFVVGSPGTSTRPSLEVSSDLAINAAKQTLVMPKLEVALPVAPHVSVALKGHLRSVYRDDTPPARGFGDLELEAKWVFFAPSEGGSGSFAMAVEPGLSFPTGEVARGLGAGHVSLELPLLLGIELERWTLGGVFAFAHAFGADEDRLRAGALATYRLLEDLRVGLEFVTTFSDARFGNVALAANVGLKWRVGRHAEIQALAGRTVEIAGASSGARFRFGVELTF